MFYKRNFLTFIGLVYVALGCLRVRARQTEAAGDLPDVLQAEFPHVHRPGLRRPRLSACTCSTDKGEAGDRSAGTGDLEAPVESAGQDACAGGGAAQGSRP